MKGLDLFFDLDKIKALPNMDKLIWDLNEREDKVPENLIDKPYAYHKPSPVGLDKINKLRAHFSEGERLINDICPNSRHRSIAITNNEQTAMWAIKAVVFNDPDSVIDPS